MEDQEPRDLTLLRPRSRGRETANEDVEHVAGATPRVLKSRFVLDDRLGTGGMGTVYRAKDLRKVEARDRFPYVAVKVLNADIRRHPEAFIALEREASRSQQLSHHNIVSIYDFDKDGDVPFMTMELLQGRELATMLNAYPHGLPANMAWPVIEGMCDGLAYAHANGVVHADFKPGNVFVTDQNVVKILDFGLARAVRGHHDGGEETAFDPAELAAMTPVYASLEMIQGEVPEAADDVYSLAVVIYMVLTGRHPYNRLPADEAQAQNVVPERPTALSLTQWRALRQALAFRREDRLDNVAALRKALTWKYPWRNMAVTASAAALLVAVTGFYVVEGAQIDEVRDEVRQVTLLDMQSARVSALIEEPTLDPLWFQRLDAELASLVAVDSGGGTARVYREQAAGVVAESMVAAADAELAVQQYLDAQFLAPAEVLDKALLTRVTTQIAAALTDAATGRDAAQSAAHQLAWVGSVQARAGTLLAPAFQQALDAERARLLEAVTDAGLVLRKKGDLRAVRQIVDVLNQLPDTAQAVKRLQPATVATPPKKAPAVTAVAKSDTTNHAPEALRELRRVLATSCLRFDLVALADVLRAHADDDNFRKAAGEQSNQRIAACIEELSAVDAELARSLSRDAQVVLDGLVDIKSHEPDPCLAPGPAGVTPRTCRDQAAFGLAPEVIVLEDPVGRFRLAVTREEISARDFAAFCAATGGCSIEPSNYPVTGVPLNVVRRYAAWLSRATGETYRLPTREEWERLAADSVGGTRHCRGKVMDLKRPMGTSAGLAGHNGLLHVFGNVSELVVDGGSVVAAGGSWRDSLEECGPQNLKLVETPDDDATGFRFVRELS